MTRRTGSFGSSQASGSMNTSAAPLSVTVASPAWSLGRPAAVKTDGIHSTRPNQATQLKKYVPQMASVLWRNAGDSRALAPARVGASGRVNTLSAAGGALGATRASMAASADCRSRRAR